MIYLELFLTFLKIGAFTFGGGYAMLPFMQQEVLTNNWMNEEQLLNFIAVAESTPGPVAINMATYIGVQTGGIFGAICATLGVVLPSFVVILLVARFYTKYKNSFVVKGCLSGMRPIVVGLIAAAIISLGCGVFFPSGISLSAFDFQFFSSLIIFSAVVVLALKKVNPIYLIIGSAALGILCGYAEKLIF
jgi:chromate transporter